MAVTLSERAARQVARELELRGKGIGLRINVRTTTCAGMAYKMEYADVVYADDKVFESHGVKVIVDARSLQHIDDTEIDFADDHLKRHAA